MRRFVMRIVILFAPSVILLWCLSPFATSVLAQNSIIPMWDFVEKSRQPCVDINDGRCFKCVNAGETFNPYYIVYSDETLYDAKVGSTYSGVVEVKLVPCSDKTKCELGQGQGAKRCTSSSASRYEYCTVEGAIQTNVCWSIHEGETTLNAWAETDSPRSGTRF